MSIGCFLDSVIPRCQFCPICESRYEIFREAAIFLLLFTYLWRSKHLFCFTFFEKWPKKVSMWKYPTTIKIHLFPGFFIFLPGWFALIKWQWELSSFRRRNATSGAHLYLHVEIIYFNKFLRAEHKHKMFTFCWENVSINWICSSTEICVPNLSVQSGYKKRQDSLRLKTKVSLEAKEPVYQCRTWWIQLKILNNDGQTFLKMTLKNNRTKDDGIDRWYTSLRCCSLKSQVNLIKVPVWDNTQVKSHDVCEPY